MVNTTIKSNCCGCSACAAACPVHCIEMKEDREGFYYPDVDRRQCVRCGLCERLCPVLNAKEGIPHCQQAYIVQTKYKDISAVSAAGGFFSAAAKYAVENGGCVCGVELTADLKCQHAISHNVNDLLRFSGSKYIQSRSDGKVFKQVKEFVDLGRTVVYGGTPCQVEGLLNYVGNRNNLYTVDLVCHSVPSQKAFDKYIEFLEQTTGGKITEFHFRDKHYGYGFPTMYAKNEHGGVYRRGMESDPFLRMYFSGIGDRPSCNSCKFKKRYRRSDFTIWDCNQASQYSAEMDDDAGASKLLIHSEKGKRLFDLIKNDFIYVETEPDTVFSSGSKAMFECVTDNRNRDAFIYDMEYLDGYGLYKKYFPVRVKHRIKRMGRVVLARTGLQNRVKNIYHSFKR